jgi:hypothetical protein
MRRPLILHCLVFCSVAFWLLRKLDAATFETAICPGVSETSEGVKIIRGGLKKSGPVTPK